MTPSAFTRLPSFHFTHSKQDNQKYNDKDKQKADHASPCLPLILVCADKLFAGALCVVSNRDDVAFDVVYDLGQLIAHSL